MDVPRTFCHDDKQASKPPLTMRIADNFFFLVPGNFSKALPYLAGLLSKANEQAESKAACLWMTQE